MASQTDILAQINVLREQVPPPSRPRASTGSSATTGATFATTLMKAAATGVPAGSRGTLDAAGQQRRNQLLQSIDDIARQQGLGEEGVRVVHAIVSTEGALNGQVGDRSLGGSYGPLQLNWNGQLQNLAKDLGMSRAQAAAWVQANPAQSVQWALRPDRYLGQTIRQGMAQGLSGAALATYAQRLGQRSVSPERAGATYTALFGGSA